MRKRFLRFTFENEAKWLMCLFLLLPLLGVFVAIVIPAIMRLVERLTLRGRPRPRNARVTKA